MMEPNITLTEILEAALLCANRPLSLEQLKGMFDEEVPDTPTLKEALENIARAWEGRVCELVKVASGYRLQTREVFATWLGRLEEERPPRYSRALLETLVLIAYRQPITRSEIGDIRGVAVTSSIIRTLEEREWIRIVGQKEVPGRPAMYATTRQFLDYFNLSHLDELPPLSDIQSSLQSTEQTQSEAQSSQQSTTAHNMQVEEYPATEEEVDSLFAELDKLEENLPDNFDALLKAPFDAQDEHYTQGAHTDADTIQEPGHAPEEHKAPEEKATQEPHNILFLNSAHTEKEKTVEPNHLKKTLPLPSSPPPKDTRVTSPTLSSEDL